MEQGGEILQWIEGSGLALVLVVFGMIFFAFKIWPWYIKRTDAKDKEESERHERYMETMEKFTGAINGINATINGLGQIISAQTDKMDDYHAEVMAEIRRTR